MIYRHYTAPLASGRVVIGRAMAMKRSAEVVDRGYSDRTLSVGQAAPS